MLSSLSALLLGLASATPILAQSAGSFSDGGDTLVSAMMMFLGNEDKLYIIDKAEGNQVQVGGHPAWGSVWDLKSRQYTPMDIKTNVFCASGMHLPNGSWVTFGGNGAVGPGGNIGSVPNNEGSADFDETYKDYDGSKSIRILNPCKSTDEFGDSKCQWYDDPTTHSMQKKRWYSAAEPLSDGTIVLIGGFVNGGYVNRNFPNRDPTFEGGAAEPTYEFFPRRGEAQQMQFMTTTSGLNSYAHTFLMPSGKMFVQANISTVLWDYDANVETPLPDMPGKVARVYPASGAVAMLPLTPSNNWTPTILFCGGSDMPSDAYGNYSHPAIDTWNYPASRDCQRITPEPTDGSSPVYVKDDEMMDTRTMGQFIILPDGKLLVINGAQNGTAGYADKTGQTPSLDLMPYAMSLAAGPVLTPSIYDPNAPAGSRWSSAGLATSTIPRLYHSSAILLPDASVFVAGSNPNVDVNLTVPYPTTYKAEIFQPPYFSASTRPTPTGVPSTLSYGGDPFNVTLPMSSYSGAANDAADKTFVSVIRGGFTTHAMNMGQRFLQLNNTYTVAKDGSITLHVAQMPPNPNIFQPGPALVFVVVNGIPSTGKHVIVGNGQMGPQPTAPASVLPASVGLDSVSGSGGSGDKVVSPKAKTAVAVGIVVAALAVIGLVGAIFGIVVARRRRAAVARNQSSYPMSNTMPMGGGKGVLPRHGVTSSDSSMHMPLATNNREAWSSNASLYRDDASVPRPYSESISRDSRDFDPYSQPPPRIVVGHGM